MKNQQPNWLKILYIVIFLAVAGYTYWQQHQQQLADQKKKQEKAAIEMVGADQGTTGNKPTLEQLIEEAESATLNSDKQTDTKSESATEPSESQNPAAKYGVESFRWSKVQKNDFTSPQGLVYGMGSGNEHRLQHVFRHAEDQPNRPGPHGVFDGTKDEILTTLDSAYKLVKFRSNDVKTETDRGRKVHLINMKKRVGYVGGQTGKSKDHPPAKKIRLVLEGTKVITAFPLWLMRFSIAL